MCLVRSRRPRFRQFVVSPNRLEIGPELGRLKMTNGDGDSERHDRNRKKWEVMRLGVVDRHDVANHRQGTSGPHESAGGHEVADRDDAGGYCGASDLDEKVGREEGVSLGIKQVDDEKREEQHPCEADVNDRCFKNGRVWNRVGRKLAAKKDAAE